MRRGRPHNVILPRTGRDARRTLLPDAQSCYRRGSMPSVFRLLAAAFAATASAKKPLIDPQTMVHCVPASSSPLAPESEIQLLLSRDAMRLASLSTQPILIARIGPYLGGLVSNTNAVDRMLARCVQGALTKPGPNGPGNLISHNLVIK
jgi:hypothetical protein